MGECQRRGNYRWPRIAGVAALITLAVNKSPAQTEIRQLARPGPSPPSGWGRAGARRVKSGMGYSAGRGPGATGGLLGGARAGNEGGGLGHMGSRGDAGARGCAWCARGGRLGQVADGPGATPSGAPPSRRRARTPVSRRVCPGGGGSRPGTDVAAGVWDGRGRTAESPRAACTHWQWGLDSKQTAAHDVRARREMRVRQAEPATGGGGREESPRRERPRPAWRVGHPTHRNRAASQPTAAAELRRH